MTNAKSAKVIKEKKVVSKKKFIQDSVGSNSSNKRTTENQNKTQDYLSKSENKQLCKHPKKEIIKSAKTNTLKIKIDAPKIANTNINKCDSQDDTSSDKNLKAIALKSSRTLRSSSENSESKCSNTSYITEYFSNLRVDSFSDAQVTLSESKQTENHANRKKNIINEQKSTSKIVSQSEHKRINQQKKKSNTNEVISHKVTDYFKIRKSERTCTKQLLCEKEQDLQLKIINNIEDGLEIKEFPEKGRGIITTKEFHKGDFVIEYIGELINGITAKQRELKYVKNKNIGCYMYYFKYKNIQHCIDATAESGKLGRLINHSRKGNLISKIIEVDQKPHLVLFAKVDIPIGTELLYDYGDRNTESVKNHPWLAL